MEVEPNRDGEGDGGKAEAFFLKEKPVATMVCLANKDKLWYARMLAKETDSTYAHMVKILDKLAEYGLITFQKEGRIRIVRLTDTGEELAHEFEALIRRLRKLPSPKPKP